MKCNACKKCEQVGYSEITEENYLENCSINDCMSFHAPMAFWLSINDVAWQLSQCPDFVWYFSNYIP